MWKTASPRTHMPKIVNEALADYDIIIISRMAGITHSFQKIAF